MRYTVAIVSIIVLGCSDSTAPSPHDDVSTGVSAAVACVPTDEVPCYPLDPIYVDGSCPYNYDVGAGGSCECVHWSCGNFSNEPDGHNYNPNGGGGTGGGGIWEASLSFAHDSAGTLDPETPSCDNLNQNDPDYWKYHSFCFGMKVEGENLTIINAALGRLIARGEPCAAHAQRFVQMLNAGQVRLFSPSVNGNYNFGGAAPLGGKWISLSTTWLSIVGTSWKGLNLDGAIMHETDHVLNHTTGAVDSHGHVDTGGFHTPHSAQCTGL